MKVFAKSDIGKARDQNEDYYYISDKEIHLYILADGMGGYNGGEIASKLATMSAKNYIESNFIQTDHTKESILELIKSAMEYANMIVYEKSKENTDLENMGTTMEICLIYEERAYIGHIGDSRIYRIRQDIMRKLSEDHSYVQDLVKNGTISKEEAVTHPKKNMLTKALGCASFIEPDIMVKGFQKEDIILICSDGLTNMIKEQEIYEIIRENIDDAVNVLINKANELGGYDNISAIIIQND